MRLSLASVVSSALWDVQSTRNDLKACLDNLQLRDSVYCDLWCLVCVDSNGRREDCELK